LNLTLGKASYVDLADPRNNREVPLNLQNQVFKNVRSESDLYAVLFVLWLRSGGALGVNPGDLARDYVGRRLDQVESTIRTNLGIHAP
jgi:hypothetical protein